MPRNFCFVCYVMFFGFMAFTPAAPADPADFADGDAHSPEEWRKEENFRINGKTIATKVIVSEAPVFDNKGEVIARLFSTAYIADSRGAAPRPIIFAFNGGPGSASAWLNFGAMGPKVLDLPASSSAGAPPFDLVANDGSVLDIADLVFVDPVGAGLSHLVDNDKGRDAVFGLRADAEYLAAFIRRFLSVHKRWNSPVYLVGESYGGFRVGVLLETLTNGYNRVELNGAVFVSSLLDFDDAMVFESDRLSYAAFLPTYAATAAYHDLVAVPPDGWDAFLEGVETFAATEYIGSLMLGSRASKARKDAVAEAISGYTGLSRDYVLGANLKINPFYFQKELLRERGLVIGRFDGRYTGRDNTNSGAMFDGDPSAYAIAGAFYAAANAFFRNEMGVEPNRDYELLNMQVRVGWDWTGIDRTFSGVSDLNAAPHVSRLLRENPDFKVMVASGYYDMSTPYMGIINSLAAANADFSRIDVRKYHGGHMFYVDREARAAFSADLRRFLLGR